LVDPITTNYREAQLETLAWDDEPMNYLEHVNLTNPATHDALQRLRVFAPLPEDYLDFLRKSNGAEGFIGDHYLILHAAEEIEPINLAAEIADSAPGLVIFGSNGGAKSYAFDLNHQKRPL
jgi:hypothetical protein